MALVFLSCGQRNGERELARQVEEMIRDDLELECYNADSVQGFDDVMSITDQLSKSDYYLFIDFKREDSVPISVFTHQEFALARAWGFSEVLAFQEQGLGSYGMVKYALIHPVKFTRDTLVEQVRETIRSKQWNKNYSRNLIVSELRATPPDKLVQFGDHTGQSLERVWHLNVRNGRTDGAAFDAVAILHSVTSEATGAQWCPDASYLKWAGQKGFRRTIFPDAEAHFDAFAIRADAEGVFLHSAADVVPRAAIINDLGRYRLDFRIFSESFPVVKSSVSLDYRGSITVARNVRMSSTSAVLVG